MRFTFSVLFDHFIFPKCKEMMLKGHFTDSYGPPDAQIYLSVIERLPATGGVAKIVATPNACGFSGPTVNLRFWCFMQTEIASIPTSLCPHRPLSLDQRALGWVENRSRFHADDDGDNNGDDLRSPQWTWKWTTAVVRGVLEVLAKVEELIIINWEIHGPHDTRDESGLCVLLPKLRRLTIYVRCFGWAITMSASNFSCLRFDIPFPIGCCPKPLSAFFSYWGQHRGTMQMHDARASAPQAKLVPVVATPQEYGIAVLGY